MEERDAQKKICVDYFIDINNKNVKLDYIEILKAYAFKERFNEISEKWISAQKANKRVPFNEYYYPLESMFLHYILCSVNSIANFEITSITDNLKLKSSIEIRNKIYEKGSDVEQIIGDNKFYVQMLDRVQKFIEFEVIVINDMTHHGKDFAKYVNPVDKDNPSYVFVQNMFNIVNGIIRSSDVVPKLLLMKFFIDVIQNEANYSDYKLIYNIGILATFFSADQGNSKQRAEFSSIVLKKDWKEALISKSEEKIRKSPLKIVFNKVVKQHGSYTENSGMYLAKRVHAILCAVTDKGNVKFHEDLFEKYNSDCIYNAEHFLINQSYKIGIKNKYLDYEYEYPKKMKKFISYLGNYLFLNSDLNHKMGNATIKDKIKIIENYKKNHEMIFKDTLSKIKYDVAKEVFENCECPTMDELSNCKSKKDVKKLLDNYFKNKFEDDYERYYDGLNSRFSECDINDFKALTNFKQD